MPTPKGNTEAIKAEARSAMQRVLDVIDENAPPEYKDDLHKDQLVRFNLGGVAVRKYSGMRWISFERETRDGYVDLSVQLPPDLGDLANAEVQRDWQEGGTRGTDTLARRDFPRAAQELIGAMSVDGVITVSEVSDSVLPLTVSL